MSAQVPTRRGYHPAREVLNGRPVMGSTWAKAGAMVNWLLGRGGQIVPAHVLDVDLVSGHEYSLAYYAFPRLHTLHRLWSFNGVAASGGVSLLVKVPPVLDGNPNPGESVTFGSNVSAASPRTVLERLDDTDSEQTAIELLLTPNANMRLYSVSAVDVPRANLLTDGATSTDECGVDLARFAPGQPLTYSSVSNIFEVLERPLFLGRRASLMQWAVPYEDNGSPTTTFAKSTTGSGATITRLPIPILAGMTTGGATRSMYCSALLWTTGGTATLTFSSSETSDTLALSSTSATPEWVSNNGFLVETESLSEDDGRPSADWDEVTVTLTRTGAAGTAYCASFGIWEEDA